jgi:hypothetical protein
MNEDDDARHRREEAERRAKRKVSEEEWNQLVHLLVVVSVDNLSPFHCSLSIGCETRISK